MTGRLKGILITTSAVAAIGAGAAAIAGATGGDDSADKPITGNALGKAKAAALAQTGGGRVTATEVGDEEGFYEVEVTRGDGSQVDVHLNRDLKVLGQQGDNEASDNGNDG